MVTEEFNSANLPLIDDETVPVEDLYEDTSAALPPAVPKKNKKRKERRNSNNPGNTDPSITVQPNPAPNAPREAVSAPAHTENQPAGAAAADVLLGLQDVLSDVPDAVNGNAALAKSIYGVTHKRGATIAITVIVAAAATVATLDLVDPKDDGPTTMGSLMSLFTSLFGGENHE